MKNIFNLNGNTQIPLWQKEKTHPYDVNHGRTCLCLNPNHHGHTSKAKK
jgi:hypothetical protein